MPARPTKTPRNADKNAPQRKTSIQSFHVKQKWPHSLRGRHVSRETLQMNSFVARLALHGSAAAVYSDFRRPFVHLRDWFRRRVAFFCTKRCHKTAFCLVLWLQALQNAISPTQSAFGSSNDAVIVRKPAKMAFFVHSSTTSRFLRIFQP